MIYADNAATTQLDRDAFEAMQGYLLEDYANASQPYSFSRKAKQALNDSRSVIAKCINADPEEIVFTSGGTESDNWAIKLGSLNGENIVTSSIEHHAILNSCLAMRKVGKTISYLPVSKEGVVDGDNLDESLTAKTGLVSIMYANNEIGSIQPIAEFARIAHQKGCYFHTDAVQAIGHVKMDVHALDVDLLSASAHKFNGPKGIGFLYIKKGVEIPSFVDGGGQENGLRAGTENIASIVAMSVALKNNCYALEKNTQYIRKLEKTFLNALEGTNLDYIRNGSEKRIPGNISLSFKGKEGEMILHRLDLQGICISTGSACDSQNTQISHVIRAINVPNDYAKGTIRVSIGKNNTEQEMVSIVNAIAKILK